MHSAGFSRADLVDSRTGVFLGMWPSDFDQVLRKRAEESTLLATAGGIGIASGRLSYYLGLNGPCFTVDTASSSALAACNIGVRSLHEQDCRNVSVLGSHLLFHHDTASGMRAVGLLLERGRCYTWDYRHFWRPAF